MITIREAMKHLFRELDVRFARAGIPTGVAGLDEITGGLRAGTLFGIAGSPACGKTSLAITIALAASAARHDVLFLSRDLPLTAIAERMLIPEAGVDARHLRLGTFSREEIRDLTVHADALSKRSITLESARSTLEAVLAGVLAWTRARRSDMNPVIVVDPIDSPAWWPPLAACARDSGALVVATLTAIDRQRDVCPEVGLLVDLGPLDETGEADMRVLRNLCGPVGIASARFARERLVFT